MACSIPTLILNSFSILFWGQQFRLNQLNLSLFYPGYNKLADDDKMQVRVVESSVKGLTMLSLSKQNINKDAGYDAGTINEWASSLLSQNAKKTGITFLLGPVLFVKFVQQKKAPFAKTVDLSLQQFSDLTGLRPAPQAPLQEQVAEIPEDPPVPQPQGPPPAVDEDNYPTLGPAPKAPLGRWARHTAPATSSASSYPTQQVGPEAGLFGPLMIRFIHIPG